MLFCERRRLFGIEADFLSFLRVSLADIFGERWLPGCFISSDVPALAGFRHCIAFSPSAFQIGHAFLLRFIFTPPE